MKHLFATYLLLIATILSKSVNAQSWMWAKNSAGTYFQHFNHHAVDPWGNSYYLGWSEKNLSDLTSTINFDALALTAPTSFNFLVKYNALGTAVWGRKYLGGVVCATDPSGNVFVGSGSSAGHYTYGPYTIYSSDSANGSSTLMFAKLDSSGNVLWVRSAGATGYTHSEVNKITTDVAGNLLVTGIFEKNITFGTTTLTAHPSLYSSQYDVFVAKYTPNGTLLWAKGFGGNGQDWPYGLAADPSGNVIVTGCFTSDTAFAGSIQLHNPTPVTKIGGQLFLVKYSSGGTVAWAKTAAGTGSDQGDDDIRGNGVATDGVGNIYVVGRTNLYSSNMSGLTVSNPSGWSQYLLAKYSPDGVCKWARITDFTDVCGGTVAVAVTVYGPYVYSIGNTGAHSIHSLDGVPVNPGYFILKADTSGHFLSEIPWPNSPVVAYPRVMDHDAQGNIYISGYMMGNCSIGSNSMTFTGGQNTIMTKWGLPVNHTPELEKQAVAQVYPNPADGAVNVALAANYTDASIVVSDILGRIVAQRQVTGNNGAPEQFSLDKGMTW